jgi:hypothetical protein
LDKSVLHFLLLGAALFGIYAYLNHGFKGVEPSKQIVLSLDELGVMVEEIASDVKTAWLGEQKQKAWEKAYAEMRARYTVFLPAAPSRDTKAQTPPQAAPKRQIPSESGGGPL